MAPPRLPRIRPVHPAGAEDRLPKQVDLLRLRRVGKHARRPRRHGRRDHAPAHPHGADVVAPERFRLLGGRAQRGRHPLGILALQQVRIAAGHGQERRALLGPVQHATHPPSGELLERIGRSMPETHQLQLVVAVGDVHVRAAGIVGARRQRAGQLHRLDRRANHQVLARLQVQAHPDRQVRVSLQIRVHGASVTHRRIAYTRRGQPGIGQWNTTRTVSAAASSTRSPA